MQMTPEAETPTAFRRRQELQLWFGRGNPAAVKRPLPGRNLRNRLVDGSIAALFRRCNLRNAFKPIGVGAAPLLRFLRIDMFLAGARGDALVGAQTIGATLARRRLTVVVVFGSVSGTSRRRRIAIQFGIAIVVAEGRPVWTLRVALAAPWRVAIPAPLLVVAKAMPPLVRLVVAISPRRSAAAVMLALVVVGKAFAPPPGRRRLGISFMLVRAVTRSLLPSIVRTAVGMAEPFVLTVFVDRRDDVVKPLPNRHARAPRGFARGSARFRTETSEIPRTARFHSHVQTT
jgi:hypothetical protein